MRHGSLFSGIGAPELAAEWMGWENIFHCEKEPFPRQILKYYWPNAISYGDITKTDFAIHRGTIDVLTGGFPCQPYSVAGKQLGTEDDRHLWPEMLRAIREIQPRWVVGENVRGLINWNGGLVFREVRSDLEIEGYKTLPFLLPACAVNAPHRRDRIWFIAHSSSKYGTLPIFQRRQITTGNINLNREDESRNVTDTPMLGFQGGGNTRETKRKRKNGIQQFNRFREPSDWQNFPTQSPICSGNDGLPTDLLILRQRIREDSMGYLSEKEIDKIISKAGTEWRNGSLMALGNSMVPQVVFQIFKAIEKYENINF